MNSDKKTQKIVVKIGTSSLTGEDGCSLNMAAIDKLCHEVAAVVSQGHHVVLVSSAAIAAGMAKLNLTKRPRDFESLQALSAVGQISLMNAYNEVSEKHDLTCGQVLLTPVDFFDRSRYLRARSCIEKQWAYGVLPVCNENDAIADDEIRFGDNDRIAALVAHLIHADRLILLTDTAGVLSADPRVVPNASLIEEIRMVEAEHEQIAGGAASEMSRGGMASKLAAAKIASWSGVETLIAAAKRPNIIGDALTGKTGIGTIVRAQPQRLSARKLWIAFAQRSLGVITVDDGAKQALSSGGASLLSVGATSVSGDFSAGDTVDIADESGAIFARGVVHHAAADCRHAVGKRDIELIHRDDLVLLPA